MTRAVSGTLAGLRVIKSASIGPGPHCAILFATFDVDVVRIDRAGGNGWPHLVVRFGRDDVVCIRSEDRPDSTATPPDKPDALIEPTVYRELCNLIDRIGPP